MSPLPLLGVVDLSFTDAKLVAFWELTKFSGIIFCIYFVVDCISMGYNQHRVMGCSSQYTCGHALCGVQPLWGCGSDGCMSPGDEHPALTICAHLRCRDSSAVS